MSTQPTEEPLRLVVAFNPVPSASRVAHHHATRFRLAVQAFIVVVIGGLLWALTAGDDPQSSSTGALDDGLRVHPGWGEQGWEGHEETRHRVKTIFGPCVPRPLMNSLMPLHCRLPAS